MKIRFACPHCAKTLTADSAAAGRTGRCRHCGQRAVVPGAAQAAAGPATSRGGQARPPVDDWRAAVTRQLPTGTERGGAARAGAVQGSGSAAAGSADSDSGYRLRPVTPRDVPALSESDWANVELGPAIVGPVPKVMTAPAPGGSSRAAAPAKRPNAGAQRATAIAPPAAAVGPPESLSAVLGVIVAVVRTTLLWLGGLLGTLVGRPMPSGSSSMVVAYRMFFGLLGKWTSWISETSYTVSFVVVVVAIASGMIGRHSLAVMLCRAIVALNILGLAGDLTSLVTLSFRKNPIQGALFLVPPLTLYYLWSDWQRYRDTVVRMRTPLLTLVAVAGAYLSVPWLHGGGTEEGRVVAAVKRAIDAVEEQFAGRKDAIDVGLEKARSWLREVPLPDPSALQGLPDTLEPAHGRKP